MLFHQREIGRMGDLEIALVAFGYFDIRPRDFAQRGVIRGRDAFVAQSAEDVSTANNSVSSAPLVVGQTLVPAIVGIWLLGDAVREGWVAAVVVGMTLAVAGAVLLSRTTVGPEPASVPGLAR